LEAVAASTGLRINKDKTKIRWKQTTHRRLYWLDKISSK